ncbi:MAG: hypothetical protein K0S25_1726, partial [Bacillus sp. (in: firmicutes)]|nr:hypothetical protein [Bacillus sp. (in: firmicutes)]
VTKKKIGILSIIIVAVIFGYFYLSKETVTVSKATSSNGENEIQVHEDENTIENEFPMDMTELDVQTAIHMMSHQKVLADQKWGAIPLTSERVTRLIQVVDANSGEYENEDIYWEILSEWNKGFFVNIVYAHNAIWDLQDGTVGEAYGIASPEEEMEYIQKNFRVK